MRVAAIDLGTNSTRLLVADVVDGRVEELHRETRITRLGEGVDERRRLLPHPIARVRNVLSDFRRIAEELGAGRTLAVATSAVRDAENGEAFLGEVEWSYGFATRLLSGDEEGQLTLRGGGAAARAAGDGARSRAGDRRRRCDRRRGALPLGRPRARGERARPPYGRSARRRRASRARGGRRSSRGLHLLLSRVGQVRRGLVL